MTTPERHDDNASHVRQPYIPKMVMVHSRDLGGMRPGVPKLLLCFSSLFLAADAQSQPVIDVFDKEITLTADCKIYGRPSALDGEVVIHCDDGSISIRKYAALDSISEDNPDIDTVDRATVEGLERVVVTWSFLANKDLITTILCDEEVCMYFAGRKPAINAVLGQVSEELKF